ncbi:hypothetical protein [Bartonella harrusi]|uniref:hypothetical protein n=1 Tax=Bartonella harrusi TaxID=2961895 RepID=UPI0035A9A2FF
MKCLFSGKRKINPSKKILTSCFMKNILQQKGKEQFMGKENAYKLSAVATTPQTKAFY